MTEKKILDIPLGRLLETSPYLRDFFSALSVEVPVGTTQSLGEYILGLPGEIFSSHGLDGKQMCAQAAAFVQRMEAFSKSDEEGLHEVTVKAGFDKQGVPEAMDVTLRTGEVICIVGPTGSGKSRLLEDIECLAQGDTPSGRRILLDGGEPCDEVRFSGDRRLVAQLSQNMNFVMDLTVAAFLTLHAESRLVENIQERVTLIFDAAKRLAGEPFERSTPVTALSGGQSRALMIADVAFLSASPIVLIDEIENAGVDRQEALALLVRQEKIVLMATHDPLLALSGHRRIVIKNGGIARVLDTTEAEKKGAKCLAVLDKRLAELREQVRSGQRLDFNLQNKMV